jgi:Cytochrome P460
MAFKWLLLTGVLLATASITFSQARALRSPVFTKDGELVLPSGFRQWVFIGGPLTPNGLNNGKAPFPEFHDVYIQQANLRFYQAHGSFPEGTVIVKQGRTPTAQSIPHRAADIFQAPCTGWTSW